MKKRFVVRPVRQLDLDRIEVIEAASFGADAYERNLFAEYTRICGGLFLVAEAGTKVIGYSITALPTRWAGERAELVSVAVDPAYLGKGAAAALIESTLRRLRRRRVTRSACATKRAGQLGGAARLVVSDHTISNLVALTPLRT